MKKHQLKFSKLSELVACYYRFDEYNQNKEQGGKH